MAESLSGKTVVVTGAGGGIGSALCQRLVALEALVVAVDIDRELLASLAKRTDLHRSIAVDLTDPEATVQALGDLRSVDVLINNAGVTALGPAEEISVEAVARVLEVNVLGSVHATRALLGSLVAARGRIGVVSSVAGFAPLLYRTAYSASKHALHGYFESLRAELADRGVSVTMVCPAFADTGIEDRAVARSEGSAGGWTTTGVHMTADEVAGEVIDGVARRKRLVLPGRTAKTAYWTWRLAPTIYEKMMRARITAGE